MSAAVLQNLLQRFVGHVGCVPHHLVHHIIEQFHFTYIVLIVFYNLA
jgi:hypothetical protein